jgi:ribose-phosphate pyrophosphokinase
MILQRHTSPITYSSKTWSGGERHVNIQNIALCLSDNPTCYYHNIWSSEDLMDLLQICEVLRTRGIRLERLVVPYFPYARQDRACKAGEARYVDLAMRLITQATEGVFSQIHTYDMHNTRSLEGSLIKNSLPQHHGIVNTERWRPEIRNGVQVNSAQLPVVVSPDTGATQRAINMAFAVGHSVDSLGETRPRNGSMIYCSKSRDNNDVVVTCNVTTLPNPSVDLLVVDDICDGGRTFMSLARVLPPTTGKKILYVTHGIFSYGVDELLNHYDEIWCWHAKNPERFRENPKVIVANEYISGNTNNNR